MLLQQLAALTTPKLTKYIPTHPTVKQSAFLLLNCRDAFYGGAAGGGKSESLLMAALQYVDVPGYNALIVRRTFRDLNQPEAIMNRALIWLRRWRKTGEVHYNTNDKRWTFPSGATLTFGYLQHLGDELQYQGAEFQFVGFDELTQFYEKQYTYLFSRLRRKAGVHVPLRMRSASNPGGLGHEWVKRRYITEGKANGRIFIPALIDDNPHLDRDEYLLSLSELDYVTRDQLLKGNWDAAYDGGLMKRQWFTDNLVEMPTANELLGAQIVRHWDLAASEPTANYPDPDYTAGVKLARTRSGVIYVLDVVRDRTTPKGVEDLVRSVAHLDGQGVDISIEQEPGSAGKSLVDHYVSTVLPQYHVRGGRPTGDKVTRAKPLSSQLEYGNIRIVRGPWNTDFINECVWFPEGDHDDQVDGFSGAYEQLSESAPIPFRQGRVAGRD